MTVERMPTGVASRGQCRAVAPILALSLAALGVVVPMDAGAQASPPPTDPVARLAEVLPPDVAVAVMERIEQARGMGLPTHSIANLALEGTMKGRSPDEVMEALASLSADLGRANDALRAASRAPGAAEVEAAAVAMRMGVNGDAVAALARSGPSGRSLTVPLLVIGGLAQRGLSSDEALARVLEGLAARVDDDGLLAELSGPGPRGAAGRPSAADRRGPPPGLGGFPGPGAPGAGGMPAVGPPDDAGTPSGRPGRGRPPGDGPVGG